MCSSLGEQLAREANYRLLRNVVDFLAQEFVRQGRMA